MKHPSILLWLLVITTGAPAADHVVEQKGKAFSTKAISIKIGDSVDFKNSDPFNHNIFSLSEVKSFDLGSFPQGQSKKVLFDKPGSVEIECAIHPEMKMNIDIKK